MFNLLNLTLKTDWLRCCPMAFKSFTKAILNQTRRKAHLTVSLSLLKWIFDFCRTITEEEIVNIVFSVLEFSQLHRRLN